MGIQTTFLSSETEKSVESVNMLNSGANSESCDYVSGTHQRAHNLKIVKWRQEETAVWPPTQDGMFAWTVQI